MTDLGRLTGSIGGSFKKLDEVERYLLNHKGVDSEEIQLISLGQGLLRYKQEIEDFFRYTQSTLDSINTSKKINSQGEFYIDAGFKEYEMSSNLSWFSINKDFNLSFNGFNFPLKAGVNKGSSGRYYFSSYITTIKDYKNKSHLLFNKVILFDPIKPPQFDFIKGEEGIEQDVLGKITLLADSLI